MMSDLIYFFDEYSSIIIVFGGLFFAADFYFRHGPKIGNACKRLVKRIFRKIVMLFKA